MIAIVGLTAVLLGLLAPSGGAVSASVAGQSAKATGRALLPPAVTGAADGAKGLNPATRQLSFEPNVGQTDRSVAFVARTSRGTAAFSSSGIDLAVSSHVDSSTVPSSSPVARPIARMRFNDAAPSVLLKQGKLAPGHVNYILGDDPAGWLSKVPVYQSLAYVGLYPGVDLTYDGPDGSLKGTYNVAPGVDPSQIGWRYDGADQLTVDPAGNLHIRILAAGGAVTLTEQAPVAWQEINGARRPVEVRYELGADRRVGFAVGAHDALQPLVIDPVLLMYSTYLGGSSGNDTSFIAQCLNAARPCFPPPPADDGAADIAIDTSPVGQANAFITGTTTSLDFPIASAVQPLPKNIGRNAFVTKLNPVGDMVYSTYFGGNGDTFGTGIALAPRPLDVQAPPGYGPLLLEALTSSGEAYFVGATTASNLATTTNAAQPTAPPKIGGSSDAFVAKLSEDGSSLVYSSYLGGTGADRAAAISVDVNREPYVTGSTDSNDFPTTTTTTTTTEAIQPSRAGMTDAFLTRFANPQLNPDGSRSGGALLHSTYLGGKGDDSGLGIWSENDRGIYLTGVTASGDFPIKNAFQGTRAGGSDAFFAKLNVSGTVSPPSPPSIVFSSYLGGSGDDSGAGVTGPRIYVTGTTVSADFPRVAALQPSNAGGSDAFLAQVQQSGTLNYSTYLGGPGNDAGKDVAEDQDGNALIVGQTSGGFPLERGPAQGTYGGGIDAFVTKIQRAGRSINYSTYLGGAGDDIPGGIASDRKGNAYVAGVTSSSNFPTSPGMQPVKRGPTDAFVSRLDDVPVSGSVDASNSTVTASPTSVPADGTTSTITVALKDALGNPVDLRTVTLSKIAGPGAPTISAPSGSSDTSGKVTFTVSSNTVGVNTFQATAQPYSTGDSAKAITDTADVSFGAGPLPVPAVADLSLTNTVSPNPVNQDSDLTYRLKVRNGGPDTAAATTVTDTLPTGVSYSSSTPAGACTHNSGTVTCKLGDIGSRLEATATIVVKASESGAWVNNASVTSEAADPKTSDNTASAPVVILPLVPTQDPTPNAPVISIADTTVNEGSGTPYGLAQFPVTLSSPTRPTETAVVRFSAGDGQPGDPSGTAPAKASDGDYLPTTGSTLSFAPGDWDPNTKSVTKIVSVKVVNDPTPEPTEHFYVTLTMAVNSTLESTPERATALIYDDEPVLSINAGPEASVNEGTTGSTPLSQLRVTLSSPERPTSTAVVRFSAGDGTSATPATAADQDYLPTTGSTLSFAPGDWDPNTKSVTKLVSIKVVGDTKPEQNENFNVTLTMAQNASIAPGLNRAEGTIKNDDGAP